VVKADLTIDDTRNGARTIESVHANARASLGDKKDITGEVALKGAKLGTGHPISGRASIDVQDNQGTFAVDFREEQKGPRQLVAKGTLDLDQKSVVVPELEFRPAPDIAWHATDPLRARLVDGGVENVHVALDSEMGSIRADVSRADKTQNPRTGPGPGFRPGATAGDPRNGARSWKGPDDVRDHRRGDRQRPR
jgi:hypothetical protein